MTAKMLLAAAVSSLSLAMVAPAMANTETCAKPAPDMANGLFQKWAAALPGHNPDLMLDFYAPEHSFKPHDRDAALTERAAIRTYWNDFVDATPKVTLGTARTEVACDTLVKTGTKTLAVDGKEVPVDFTMEFKNHDGKWLIARHELVAKATTSQ